MLDRRQQVRHSREYWHVRGAKVRHGPSLRILNLSATGIFVEVGMPLGPGRLIHIVFEGEGEGPERLVCAAARVVRGEVSALIASGPTYRVGLHFESSLALEPATSTESPEPDEPCLDR